MRTERSIVKPPPRRHEDTKSSVDSSFPAFVSSWWPLSSSVPQDLIGGEHRPTQTGSHVVILPVVAAHRHHAAVAAAHAAAHDALDRHLTGTFVSGGGLRGGGKHPFRSAR